MKIIGTHIGLILVLFLLSSCQKEKAEYAALIDGQYEISKQKLTDYHQDLYFQQRFPDSEYNGYDEALDELIIRKLKQIEFVKNDLHRDQELMSNIQRVINEELLVLYFDEKYLGQYINEEVIQDYYQGLGREVTYQQIVLRKDNAENLESLKQKASEIQQKAQNTDDFASLVSQYSEDRRTAQRDGRMPVMTWDMGTASPQNQVIFRMREGSVQVLESSSRILIVKVNNVEEVDLRPLEEIKPEIKKELREVYSPRAFSDYDRDKENLLDESEYEWNTDGLNKLVEWARIEGFYRQAKYKEIIEEHIAEGNNFEILKYQNGTVDLQKYLYLLNNILLVETSANPKPGDFKKFIDEALRTELIVENAREMGLDEDILSLSTDSPVILAEFVRLYDQEFIFSRIPEANEENYQKFYELTKDSLFYQPDKVNLRVKVFDTEEAAQEAMSEINSGKAFEDAFHAWSVKTYIINKKGEIESYLSPEPNYLGDAGFKLSEGETAGPVSFTEEGETKFAVIKANNVEKEKTLTLDEVHPPRLRRMFRNYYFNIFSSEVAEKLRNNHTIVINEQALTELSASK
ncbi:MAG: hypothetical protein CL666_16735 [Balneola sp.]|nr:hypothetical protein [Balneola sp.]|tara:strand:- start:25313 stop:27040 length:1728 start_codon:yes stop_codon:yes gene_type:complete